MAVAARSGVTRRWSVLAALSLWIIAVVLAALQVIVTGLQNMRDRLEALGGSLLVDSAPGMGTTIEGRVPVSPAAVV